MLTLAAIKENPQEIVRRLAVKHFDAEKLINEILELDQARRTAQARFDQNGADLNKLAAQIGALMKSGKKDEAEGVKAQVAELKAANKAIEEEVTKSPRFFSPFQTPRAQWCRKARQPRTTL